jgi:succinyl-diaminopimelate desuccinylase
MIRQANEGQLRIGGRTVRERTDVVELTRTLIGFNTINPPGNERPCTEHLGNLLGAAGFAVTYHEFAPGRTSLVARLGDAAAKPALCFAGHVDTVPLGAAPWSVDPLAGEEQEGKVFGRGSSDMKAGVAAFVVAALELADFLRHGPGLVLAIVSGEETGCEGSFHLAGIPDALGDVGAIVVAEPTSNEPLVGHKGALWVRARTRGVTAHGSMPERGVNAIYKAARAVGMLEQFDFGCAPHPHLGAPTLNVGTISGGLNINSVPDEATIGVDMRTIPGQVHAEIVRRLGRDLGEEVELEPVMDVNSLWTDPQNPWMQEVFETMTQILGRRPEVKTVAYFTDAAALTPACGGAPTVILGPGEPGLAHQTDEYCRVDRIHQAVEAYQAIARNWCAE